MRRISVSELKNRLSHYLRLVKKGESIEIVERDIPIARVVGLSAGQAADGQLERMVRAGLVVAPRQPLDVEGFLRESPIPTKGDPARAVIEGRGER